MMQCYVVWHDGVMQLMLMHKCFIKNKTLHSLRRFWSLFTFYLGGILALRPRRNEFGAKLSIPLGTTLELLHLLLRWHFSSVSP
jgi:hypothetical protein